MEKCLISLHSGVFIYGNNKQNIKQNNLSIFNFNLI